MKKIFTLFLLIVSSQYLPAQQQVYKIDYTLLMEDSFKTTLQELDSSDNPSTSLVIDMLEGFQNEVLLQAWVGKNKNKIQSNFFDKWVQIRDTEAELLTRIDSANSTFTNMAYEREISAMLKPIEFSSETKTVAGQTCKLAILAFDVDEIEDQDISKIQIWYAEHIPQIVWGEYQYLKEVPGAALEISTGGISFLAKEVSTISVPDTFFEIPAEYSEAEETDGYTTDIFDDFEMGDGIIAYYDEDLDLFGMKKNTGEKITEPIFSSITPFNNNRAIASYDDNSFGLVDRQGNHVTNTNFEYIAYDAQLNAFQYMLDDKMSMMDENGTPIWKNSYDYFIPFTGNYSVVTQEGNSGIIDQKGQLVLPMSSDLIVSIDDYHYILEQDGEFKAYQIKSNRFVVSGYTYLSTTNTETLFKASQDGDNFGLIDNKGQVVLPFEYSYITDFSNGLATAMKNGENEEVTINAKGQVVKD